MTMVASPLFGGAVGGARKVDAHGRTFREETSNQLCPFELIAGGRRNVIVKVATCE